MNKVEEKQKTLIKKIISEKPRIIKNKREYYALYQAGSFGNKPLTWNSYEEILESGWKKGVCIRSRKGIDRDLVSFNIQVEDVPEAIKKYSKVGHTEKDLTFNQGMPDQHLAIQGEVITSLDHLNLIYTTITKPMLQALSQERIYEQGLTAMHTLRRNLDPNSFEDLMILTRMFPQSAIEFSSYSIEVGNLPNRNTIFWEVRNY